jgi:hypothetical protein
MRAVRGGGSARVLVAFSAAWVLAAPCVASALPSDLPTQHAWFCCYCSYYSLRYYCAQVGSEGVEKVMGWHSSVAKSQRMTVPVFAKEGISTRRHSCPASPLMMLVLYKAKVNVVEMEDNETTRSRVHT